MEPEEALLKASSSTRNSLLCCLGYWSRPPSAARIHSSALLCMHIWTGAASVLLLPYTLPRGGGQAVGALAPRLTQSTAATPAPRHAHTSRLLMERPTGSVSHGVRGQAKTCPLCRDKSFGRLLFFPPSKPWDHVLGECDSTLSPVLQVGFWLWSLKLIEL